MRCNTMAGCAVVHLAWMGPHIFNEFTKSRSWDQRGLYEKRHRQDIEQRDWCKRIGIVAQLLEGVRCDHHACRTSHENCVTVRPCICDILCPQASSSAGLILDNDGLPEVLFQLLCDQPCVNVELATRSIRHDQGDRSFWILSQSGAAEHRHSIE